MIVLEKYKEDKFVLPAVIDSIDFESHLVLDVIQVQDEIFKKDTLLQYEGIDVIVFKKLKNYPIQTSATIQNRTMVRRVRYYCNKILKNDQKNNQTTDLSIGIRNES